MTRTDARPRPRTANVLAVLAGLLSACGSGTTGDVAAGPADDPDVVIGAIDNAFDPASTAVDVDGPVVVELRNTGSAPHNLVATDGQVATELVPPGETVHFTIDPGASWSYECTLHPDMEGSISIG